MIWFILIIILISIVFYNRLRVRDYYFSNEAGGDLMNFGAVTSEGYYPATVLANPLEFRPLYSDRNRKISGGLVILTNSTTKKFYNIRVMYDSKQLSQGVYRIDPGLCYNNINFSVDKGDDRKLTLSFQECDPNTGLVKVDNTKPTGINLVKAWSYYY